MPRRVSGTVIPAEDQARRELDDELAQAIAEIAAEMGPAPGAKSVSVAKERSLWAQRDPKVDYDRLLGTLQATGLPPEQVDPASEQALMVIQENPAMAQHYAEAVAPEVAEVLAVLAEYPFRLSVLESLADDPEAMVKKAERLDAWFQKMHGAEMGSGVGLEPTQTGPKSPLTASSEDSPSAVPVGVPAPQSPSTPPRDVPAPLPGATPQPAIPSPLAQMVGG